MKLKYDFIFQNVGEQWVGIPVGMNAIEYNCVLHLNEVGHDIVEILKEDTDRETLINKILDMYDAQREQVEQSVDNSIKYLIEQNLLIQ